MDLKKKKTIFTIGLIIGLLIISGLLFLCIHLSKKQGEKVVVRIDGEEVLNLSLSDSGTYELNGGTNVLVISDHEAYMKDALCPDHICVKTGHINMVNESIVCLPNKVTVTIEGSRKEEIIR